MKRPKEYARSLSAPDADDTRSIPGKRVVHYSCSGIMASLSMEMSRLVLAQSKQHSDDMDLMAGSSS